MKKLFVLMIFLVLLSLASAGSYYNGFSYKEDYHRDYYYPKDYIVISNNIYVDYDDENRLSTEFYRNGYSYRTSTGYWQDNHRDLLERYDNDNYYMENSFRNPSYFKNYNHRDRYPSARYYYDFNPYLDSYEIRECYDYPPRGKMFYRTCP